MVTSAPFWVKDRVMFRSGNIFTAMPMAPPVSAPVVSPPVLASMGGDVGGPASGNSLPSSKPLGFEGTPPDPLPPTVPPEPLGTGLPPVDWSPPPPPLLPEDGLAAHPSPDAVAARTRAIAERQVVP